MEKISTAFVDWAVAALTLPGQTESGDRYVVRHFAGGVLVGVVDGLGHGKEAAAAAEIAVETLGKYAQESAISLIRRCHEKLVRTRGAVMSMASFSPTDSALTWLGVGNVSGFLQHRNGTVSPAQESLLPRGGVVGGMLPRLYASIIPVMPGDTLVIATDGIRSGYADNFNLTDTPQRIADHILARHARTTDDALVLVVRFLEARNEAQPK
jgi:phosphoserine phosphatase RsbX